MREALTGRWSPCDPPAAGAGIPSPDGRIPAARPGTGRPFVGQRDLTGMRHTAASGQPRSGDIVVRSAEGPGAQEPHPARQRAGHGMELGGLEGFLPGHVGKDGGQTFGKHAFAGAGRADEQDIVGACRRDFQGPSGGRLPHHIGEIGGAGILPRAEIQRVRAAGSRRGR